MGEGWGVDEDTDDDEMSIELTKTNGGHTMGKRRAKRKVQSDEYVFTHLDGTPLNEEDEGNIISNPVLAGIGPYRPVVSDQQWIRANVVIAKHEGAESTIKRILSIYAEAFPALALPDADLYIEKVNGDPTPVFQSLLGELRAIFEEGIHPERVRIR
jgi:hypothetical protein